MGEVIHILFHEDLPTNKQNELRGRMEMAAWHVKWRAAKEADDYDAMDRLDRQYNMVGLP